MKIKFERDKRNKLRTEAKVLSNSSEKKILIYFFAKKQVAVKIKINNRIQELTAKGTNSKGNLFFLIKK